MNRLQEQFDSSREQTFALPSGEYQGPLRISRSCVIDGGGATLWAARGPVLVIAAPGVTVKNLRVEITEATAANQTAILAEHSGTVLENVEVRGDLSGFPGEAPHWDLPSLLSLGEFAAGKPNSFAIRVRAPAPAELLCEIGGVSLSPARLQAGEQTILLQADALRDHTILYGDILVKTGVIRRICITGKSLKDGPERRGGAPKPASAAEGPVPAPAEILAPASPQDHVAEVKRGQRVSFQDLGQGVLKAALEYQGPSVELDSYIFLLQANGKVRGDADFVFFGNPRSPDGAVRLADSGGQPLALADLEAIDPAVERVAFCYSIYGDDPRKNFAQVREPMLRIFAGDQEVCRLKLEDLRVEKTLVAAEAYRYKGQWKLKFVGAGYQDGLRRLCEEYGVDVE